MGSLAELIYGSKTAEGILPDSFSLPDDTEEGKPRFADGAMDGIMIYHMGHTPLKDEEKNELVGLLKLAGDGKFDEAEGGFALFCGKHRVVSIIDDIQRLILDNKDSLDPNNMYRFAVSMLTKSADKECLKVGLSILELFDAYTDNNLADVIRTVGLSDEFTIFSVWILYLRMMRRQESGFCLTVSTMTLLPLIPLCLYMKNQAWMHLLTRMS